MRAYPTVPQRSTPGLGIDIEHDVLHIASGHCASALLLQLGILHVDGSAGGDGGGKDGNRVGTAHATASSFSSVWQLSDEPEVVWKSGARLEKEVHVLGHLA